MSSNYRGSSSDNRYSPRGGGNATSSSGNNYTQNGSSRYSGSSRYGSTPRGSNTPPAGPGPRGSTTPPQNPPDTGRGQNMPAVTPQNPPPEKISRVPKLPNLTERFGTGNASPYRATGSVQITGKVVSYQVRKRRSDFFHVFFDTLINGAPMTFSPICQVMTVELNDSDYTQIDADTRRSVVVNAVGNVYDGAIRVQDTVSIQGQWTTHQTINASRITNLTNGSHITTSHALPAIIVRLLTVALIVGIILLVGKVRGFINNPAAPGSPSAPSGGPVISGDTLATLLFGCVLLWFLFGISRRWLGRFLGKALWILAGVVLFIIVMKTAPGLVYSLLTIALMVWGIIYMIKIIFR